jgi:pre-mRNA-splicing helicase BRR2
MLTGQTNQDVKLIEQADLVITKPEFWDQVSRRWKQRKFFKKIGLFLVEELHLLGSQGSVLEVITSRMRFVTT